MSKDDPTSMPTIAILKAYSLTNAVQHEIERMILSGELPAGSRLNENALASKLSVSRGPIREACRALSEASFVHFIPNRGFFVNRLTKEDAIEVYDLRAGLVGLAGALLAPVVTSAQIKDLKFLLKKLDIAAQAGKFSAYYPLNLQFHELIVDATGNSRLKKAYKGLVKEFHLFRPHGLVQKDALVSSNKEHRRIVDALKNRDVRKSYELGLEHVINGKHRMLLALGHLEGDGTAEAV